MMPQEKRAMFTIVAAWVVFAVISGSKVSAQGTAPIPPPSHSPSPAGTPSAGGAVSAPTPDATQQYQTPEKPLNVPDAAATAEMTAEMERLKSQGKITSNRAISAAVRKVVNDHSIQHEIPAPMGAKVVAVYKQPGDMVRAGEKIVMLLVDGKQVPILAKQDGIMQTINVSKGGVIGNSRPRAAKKGDRHYWMGQSGAILLTLRTP